MSKFQECLDTYDAEFKKLGIKYDAKLLAKVAKGCGPTIYKPDSAKVATSDKTELERVKKNFLIKKLGLKDEEKMAAESRDLAYAEIGSDVEAFKAEVTKVVDDVNRIRSGFGSITGTSSIMPFLGLLTKAISKK